MKSHGSFLALLVLFCVSATVGGHGQGLLVPESAARLPRPVVSSRQAPPRPDAIASMMYKISKIEVNAKLTDQVAEVQVSQSFVNTGTTQMEVSFVFPLPYDGAIDQLTLMVEGKEFPATLMPADKARSVYEGIVRQNKDPALLEWIGTGMFRTSVFPVPAGATRTVTLKYTQLCRRADGLTDFLFPLGTAKYTVKPVEKITVNLIIDSADPIRNVYSPSQDVKIERPAENRAKVAWEVTNVIPASDFRLLYDVGKEQITTRVLSYRPTTTDDGYFLLLASPQIVKAAKPLPKTVFFVLDTSGSMSGKKIEQAREAAKFLLNNLRDGDRFNIMTYNSTITLYKETMQTYDAKTRKEALAFADGINASGGTGINTALTRTMELLAKADDKNPKYVFFLTDGCPTVGEMNEMKIVENAQKANKVNARIFAFGVGFDLNSRLLDKLVRESFGQSEFVKPDENIEERVSNLYQKLESPVLAGAKMTFTPAEDSEAAVAEAAMVNRVYPAAEFDLFAGDQLVICGRYKYPGKGTLKITGKIADGVTQEFEYPLEFTASSPDSRYAFAEKLWAIRRIGEIIDELDLRGQNQEILDELIALSTKHGILTPYTSFLADENTSLADRQANVERAQGRAEALAANATGEFGVRQRLVKDTYQNAQNNAKLDSLAGDLLEEEEDLFVEISDTKLVMDQLALKEAREGFSQSGDAVGWDAIDGPVSNNQNAQGVIGKASGVGRGAAAGKGGGTTGERYTTVLKATTRPAPTTTAPALSPAAAAKREQLAMVQNVRNVQNRTFFYKENQWVDSSLSDEQQQAAPRKIQQFSDEYFELIREAEQDVAPFLVFDEAVLLCANNEMVLIEP
ncbi:MAG: VWA domain-containing protein [Phycisphaerae bacterium]|nr:VWA domain-containing protein [Phycisphaerae bacterium]